jgi:hypothetical protein
MGILALNWFIYAPFEGAAEELFGSKRVPAVTLTGYQKRT